MYSTLTVLNLSECPNMDSLVLMSIIDQMQKQQKLKILKLDRCSQISDKAVFYALSNLVNLQEISLMFCEQLSGHSLCGETNFDVENSITYQLQHIYLGGSSNISEKSLVDFFRKCPKLKTCSIPAINEVADPTLITIGSHCPNLQHLNIALCPLVSTVGVHEILCKCKNMKHLDVGGVKKLDDTIMEDIYTCRSLKALDISNNVLISEASVLKVVQGCPSLNTLKLRNLCFSEEFYNILGTINPTLTWNK